MAMEFINNGGAQVLASVSTFVVPTSVSVSFWLNLASLDSGQNRPWGSHNNFECRFSGTGGFLIVDFGGPGVVTAVTAIGFGIWNHYVVHIIHSATAGNGDNKIYLNGVLDVSNTNGTSGTAPTSTLTLGNRTGASVSQGINGQIDDFRIYNRILAAAEVATIFEAKGTDPIVDGLIIRATLDEASPGTVPAGAGVVKDVSTTKNNFTPTGSPAYSAGILRGRKRVA